MIMVHDIEEIADSICVAQVNDRGDSRAILFVKVKNGHILEKDIICKIEENILKEFTIFYIPKVILQVKDIPSVHLYWQVRMEKDTVKTIRSVKTL
ncbi:unnamed protein product [Larinioides sclopetarius]|uniref:Acetyl-CoA synthetase n=1 Tax=Larinioides sclopetarius TaxID=280406 RepID=A0AAV2B2M5_9ARAC